MVCCFCFPPSARVLTTSGYIAVKNLRTTDKPLVISKKNGRLTTTEFYTYLHYDPQLSTEFLVFKCDNGAELMISEKHLLFRGNRNGKSKPVRANEVAVGDSLVFVNEQKLVSHPTVVEIGYKSIVGVFAPLTDSGTLIVDGFQASCYAEVGSHKMAHAAMAPLRFWFRSLNLGKPAALKASKQTGGHRITEAQVDPKIHAYAKVLASLYYGVRM